MPERRQVTNFLAPLAWIRAAGRSAFASMPMVALLAVTVSTVHGFVPRAEPARSVLLDAAEAQGGRFGLPEADDAGVQQRPAETRYEQAGESSPVPSATLLVEIQRHLARARSAMETRVRPSESAAQQNLVAQDSERAGRQAQAVRPPLKLTAEQRKVAEFVSSKYRVALDDVQHFVAHAYQVAREFRLDPHLILAVVSVESSFNPKARSPKGAQGLMQVLTRVHTDKFAPFGGPAAAFDPVANITVGSAILKEYLVREGTVEGALKSYVGAALLPHDFGYGRKVLGERERIAAAAKGLPVPGERQALAKGASGPATVAGLEPVPDVARVAPNSGMPGETKTIPLFAVEQPMPWVDVAPAASVEPGGKEAVAQLLDRLSVDKLSDL
ncbi:lytic transglycosylase domain-containing protein [Burkholderiaceae bacterium FT117]|uniref:lytic transglycosylase domain-containing protein n=1 Tax=Zeimonas sediminis TaxID=2944268 RepID=UPI002342F898|nr:lytic transglycosylase domain-containing protein [Zeimonas sediminis]MCM5570258.1 lytic transglycosylase domain-containing protein [Zeimonas sediminis]